MTGLFPSQLYFISVGAAKAKVTGHALNKNVNFIIVNSGVRGERGYSQAKKYCQQ